MFTLFATLAVLRYWLTKRRRHVGTHRTRGRRWASYTYPGQHRLGRTISAYGDWATA